MKLILLAAITAFLFTTAARAADADAFGTKMLYPTVKGGREWACKWGSGEARTITDMKRDSQDGEFIVRGNGSVTVDGKGVAVSFPHEACR